MELIESHFIALQQDIEHFKGNKEAFINRTSPAYAESCMFSFCAIGESYAKIKNNCKVHEKKLKEFLEWCIKIRDLEYHPTALKDKTQEGIESSLEEIFTRAKQARSFIASITAFMLLTDSENSCYIRPSAT